MTIDAHVKQAFANPEPDEIIRDCLEISHSLFISPLLIVNDYLSFTYGATTYTPYPFEYSLPALESGENQQASFKIANVSKTVGDKLLLALTSEMEPITVAFKQYVTVGATTYLYTFPLPLYVDSFNINREWVNLSASFHDLYNMPFLSETYSPARFPGLQG